MRAIVAALLILLAPNNAFAWGQTGHRVTGAIAEPLLNRHAAREVRGILGNETLAEASTWADEMRSNPDAFWQRTANPWHYVTVPAGKTYAEVGAPPVGDAVTALANYRQWTAPFSENSYFEGGWNTGNAIRFLSKDAEGKTAGMTSEIAISKYPEYISIRHLGIIQNGVEDLTSDEVAKWANGYENYSIDKIDRHQTRFTLDMDVADAYYDMMLEMWLKALPLLKSLSEKLPIPEQKP